VLYFLSILVFTWLNWKNSIMHGILPYYKDFAGYFGSGFSSNFDFAMNNPTFPMWGYGLIFLITQSKYIIILFQLLLMAFVVYKWDNYLGERLGHRKIFRLLILMGACYIMFNVPLWPYSISCSLIMLSIYYLFKTHEDFKWKTILYSAVLLGVALNMRSDYFYFALTLPVLILLFKLFSDSKIPYKAALIYYPLLLICLIPWMMHTNRITDQMIPTSTNSGHVMFISLGQMPNNPWKIIPSDGDPRMKQIVKENLGQTNTLDYKANKVLKDAFIAEVKKHPGAYLKKCFYNLYYTAVRPFSNGEIEPRFISNEDELSQSKLLLKSDVKSFKVGSLIKNILNGTYSVFIISIVLNLLNIILLLIFVYHIIYGLIKHRFKILAEFELYILFAVIGYQITLQTLFFYHPNYHTNVFVFYVIAVVLIRNLRSRRKIIA